jgi:hypothetical protein
VEINDVEGMVFLERAKCPSTIRQNRFEEKWIELFLETVSILFNPADIFHIRFMVR